MRDRNPESFPGIVGAALRRPLHCHYIYSSEMDSICHGPCLPPTGSAR